MYRIGHGDCFLIAFAGETENEPVYVLIDCGYKPGSPDCLASPTTAKKIGADILAATGGTVDIAIVTHEHQDHLNGLTKTNLPGLKVKKVWYAWTENPKDEVANALRAKFKDRLLGLIDARNNLLGAGENDIAGRIDDFLAFELGDTPGDYNGRTHLAAAGKDPAKSRNKVAMKFLRECSQDDPDYLYPHSKIRVVPGSQGVRAFVLGPPRDMDKIDDLDPHGEEEFGDAGGQHLAAAVGGPAAPVKTSPFPRGHVIALDQIMTHHDYGQFFSDHYGDQPVADVMDGDSIAANPDWRRIGADDAKAAGELALAMNNATNNSSLVLAFELSKGGKVLLFAGDAQAGNWRSWADADFDDDGTPVRAKDLLARAVLYKVGHHGSHNATLNGSLNSKHPNIAWMAQDRFAPEFVAMITAVEAWAHQKPRPDWNHPLPTIKTALLNKAGGRVLQTDTGLAGMGPVGAGVAEWQSFVERVSETELYFDLTIKA